MKIWMSKASATPPSRAWVRIRLPLSKTTAPARLNAEHGAHVAHDRGAALPHQRLRIVLRASRRTSASAAAGRHIAVDEIVRRGLVGDDVGNDAARQQRLVDVGGVAQHGDRRCAAFAPRRLDHRQRVVEIGGAAGRGNRWRGAWRCARRRSRRRG